MMTSNRVTGGNTKLRIAIHLTVGEKTGFSDLGLTEPGGRNGMQDTTFIVVDGNYRNRHELTLALGDAGYVVPADTLEDLGGRWPDHAWMLVHDGGDLLAATQEALHAAGKFYPLVAYAEQASIARVMDVLGGGAVGYLEWPTAGDELRRCLANIMNRKRQSAAATLEQAQAKQRIGALSPREKEVLHGVCEGFSSKEVARTLGISPRTVELHRANVLTKLGVRNLAAAVRLSVEAELAPSPASPDERELAA